MLQKEKKEGIEYIQENSHFSYINLTRYSRVTRQHLQAYTRVIKSLTE